ncbi:MAG: hypothetical protein MUP90_14395 [Gammaproteobacteria bacterium]|nr:hypothetical protein [Gammaproteobacteria bacterium]
MSIRRSQPSHLKKPLLLLCVGLFLYAVLVITAFDMTSSWLLKAGDWRPYVAAIPGLVLSGLFILLYAYMRHNDELMKEITLKSLAAACVLGLAAQLVSISRAQIGGYPEFEGATMMVVMAAAFLIFAMALSWRHR